MKTKHSDTREIAMVYGAIVVGESDCQGIQR
jgi:hypothetical protein